MLDLARKKSLGLANAQWVQADMQSFLFDEIFPLVIIPGHSFQHLTTPEGQYASLRCIRHHMQPDRLVIHVDHVDLAWLGGLGSPNETRFEPRFEPRGEFVHPTTGQRIRTFRSWSYERATQTAISRTRWEEVLPDGSVGNTWQ